MCKYVGEYYICVLFSLIQPHLSQSTQGYDKPHTILRYLSPILVTKKKI